MPEQDTFEESDIEVEVDVDIELEEPKSKPKMVDLELTSEEQLSEKLRVEALEDFAQGIINCFSKLPEKVCSLCERREEDLEYAQSRRRDRIAALEALAEKMLKWKRPDEALMQRRYAEGYKSLVKERNVAVK